VWDQPDASKGREVVSAVTPKIPAWVAKQGLTLLVSVSFTLRADGVVSAVIVDKSSGYADVDSAVVDAIRRWRFTAATGTASIKGEIPFKITSK
jgi:TonB family protein